MLPNPRRQDRRDESTHIPARIADGCCRPTIAAADAGFRNLVGLTNDTRLTQVHVNGEDHCRIIVAGEFVPPL